MAKDYTPISKGISKLEQDNGYTVVRLHYSADPIKDEAWIKREKAAYPYVELWQQEMELDFISSAGKRVYPEFSLERNTAELKREPYTEIWRGWDFGYGHPAVVWVQKNHLTQCNVLACMMGADKTIQVFAKEVIDVGEKMFPGAKYKDAGDPACRQKNDKSEQTTADILRVLYGIRMQSRPTRVADGIRLIRTMLTPRPDGFVRLKVNKTCELIIDGFLGGYVRDEDDDPVKDKYYDHCLSGDTKIRTLRGWFKIADLVGKEFYTYAYDSMSKRLVPAKAHSVRRTRQNTELWKLSLDTGELIATPDHLIMLRDGSYRQLQTLQPGDELMPFYEMFRGRKGHKTINLNDGSIVDEHRYVYNWFNGNLRAEHHIHHIDGDATNNDPSNLQQLLAKEHMAEVYSRLRKAMKGNKSSNPWTPECRNRISRWAKGYWVEHRVTKVCPICLGEFMGIPRQVYCTKKCYWKADYAKHVVKVNHKVVSVAPYGMGDTYNLEVDNYQNFPANGIMVHNSMDALRYVTTILYDLRTGDALKPAHAWAPKRSTANSTTGY